MHPSRTLCGENAKHGREMDDVGWTITTETTVIARLDRAMTPVVS
jgi:hypothetical protein